MNANQKTMVRTYTGAYQAAMAEFQDHASKLEKENYYPINQNWVPGSWGCGAFLVALILCFVLVGILVFIFMLIVKPDGTLTVTYEYREPKEPIKVENHLSNRIEKAAQKKELKKVLSIKDIDIDEEEKECPACSEKIKLKARKCKHCGEWIDEEELKQQIETRKEEIQQSITEQKKRQKEKSNRKKEEMQKKEANNAIDEQITHLTIEKRKAKKLCLECGKKLGRFSASAFCCEAHRLDFEKKTYHH